MSGGIRFRPRAGTPKEREGCWRTFSRNPGPRYPRAAQLPRGRESPLAGPAFLIPLFFFVLLGSIIYFFGLLSFDAKSPADLLDEIRNSRGERRAVAAFELSRMEKLDFTDGGRSAFVSKAVQTFEEEAGGDLRIRRALALTLGRMGDPIAAPGLVRALEDPDIETQLYGIWGLGAIASPGTADSILPRLRHEDPAIRKMAAFALGQIGDTRAVPALRISLQDSTPDVVWNSAIALARMGDESSLPILVPLLLSPGAPADLTPGQREDLKINIIRSLRRFPGPPVKTALRKVAGGDPSPRVRSEARRSLEGSSDSPQAPLPPDR